MTVKSQTFLLFHQKLWILGPDICPIHSYLLRKQINDTAYHNGLMARHGDTCIKYVSMTKRLSFQIVVTAKLLLMVGSTLLNGINVLLQQVFNLSVFTKSASLITISQRERKGLNGELSIYLFYRYYPFCTKTLTTS